MASTGDLINKTNIGNSIAYESSGDTSTSYWTYAFGNSIFWKVWTSTASSIWVKHPAVACEFWRYSISQQAWVQVHAVNIGKSTQTIYRVRCDLMPYAGVLRAEYDGDDSYLFAFRAYTYEGERSRTGENIVVYNLGADTQYNTTALGKLIYGRNEDIAYKFHYNNTGPSSLDLNENWLKTAGMRGELIIPAYAKRMVSAKSAISFT